MLNSIADALTPEQRRKEVAAILGHGLLRLRSTCKYPPETCETAPKSADQKALDVSAPCDPHVSWLTQPRS
jgi:hypothetical protein